MKVFIITARGLEGCGLNRFCIAQAKYHKQQGHVVSMYASGDKKWGRDTTHDNSDFKVIKFANEEQLKAMIEDANSSDIVIINSLPAVKHPEEAIDAFKRFLVEVKAPIALVQHDHNMISIKRNAALEEAVKRADIIFAHSKTNDFATYVEKTTNAGLSFLFGEQSSTAKRVFGFQPGMDFDEIREKYWKGIDAQDPRVHRWIGREAMWKGIDMATEFGNNHLPKIGHLMMLEGVGRSIAFTVVREKYDFIDCTKHKGGIGTYDFTDSFGKGAHVFNAFKNSEMLERMSTSGFGYQLTRLKPQFIERSLEYTHCEVVCAGVVPVFRKSFGDKVIHRHYGRPLTQCKDSGTIWLDEENMEPALELIQKLSADPLLRAKYREDAYEFYKLHQDASYTFKEMFEHMQTVM